MKLKRRNQVDRPTTEAPDELVELRLQVPRRAAAALEAGVACREARIEPLGDGRVALLLLASDREQWLMSVMARAEHGALN